ncbi:DUF3732 domain-containing protein [Bosea sp. ASV33]|uniref:DUF3732 domain-containing protein n=1 Tax=Bosea sp. ASV33 TaxID=2795106 RepID=UPI0018EBB66B
MTRWNVAEIAFYSTDSRRRIISFKEGAVNIITGASGTGKSAIIDAIDYCLGSSSCGLPYYVREHAVAVAVRWLNGDKELIVGRNIPRAGKGTAMMYVKAGRNLQIPEIAADLEGPTNRDTARQLIERAFGIDDIDSPELAAATGKGRATIRDVTPYLFLSGDVIISRGTLLHDLNRSDKAPDIKATIPFFVGAVDQETVLAERKLRQLEAAYTRLSREAKARERSRGRTTERAMTLLSQAAAVGLVAEPDQSASDQSLLDRLQELVAGTISPATVSVGDVRDQLSVLEEERTRIVTSLQAMRERKRALTQAIREASGYTTATVGQAHKLNLIKHLKLDSSKCPVCESDNPAGQAMAAQIRDSLELVSGEVAAVERLRPELIKEAAILDQDIGSAGGRLREVDAQMSGIIRLSEDAAKAASLAEERAIIAGRAAQFLEMTAQDVEKQTENLDELERDIRLLKDLVDPEAKRDRIRYAETVIGDYATAMLTDLPTEVPVTGARLMFHATPKVTIVEKKHRAVLSLAEIGSDQNYLAIHLALSFSLQKHFQDIEAPVPGLLVIDQISRPYYPEGGDEKSLADMAKDSDRLAMRKIIRFLFEEIARQQGLQIILLEHAYIEDDPEYVGAVRGRWTLKTGEKLIPTDWPSRPN